MNTAVIITAIICVSIVIIALFGGGDSDGKD